MKRLEDKEIGEMLKNNLLQNAPSGMIDRIMANIAVQPKRITIKPLEPSPFLAMSFTLLTAVFLIIGIFIKPQAWLTISWDIIPNLDLNIVMPSLIINPLWIAPVAIFSLVIWGYIVLSNFTDSAKTK